MPELDTAEHARLAEATGRAEDDLFNANPWYEWGPYLSERAWGTVREDYSEGGDAWDYFPHDHARSRAYRWNEDGMAGISDIRHELCLALALWNGNDAILKERMFGLTGPQGNHGEDAKEYWWYLEGLPSHALLQVALPLPAGRVPVRRSSSTTAAGSRIPSWSCWTRASSTATATGRSTSPTRRPTPTEVLMRIELENHGPDEATLQVLPTLWFRNTWSWDPGAARPRLQGDGSALVVAEHPNLAGYRLDAAPGPDGTAPEALFCENETNAPRVFGSEATTPYPKDGINDHVVSGAATVNPEGFGTKAALRYRVTVPGRRQGRAAAASCTARPTGRPTTSWSAAAFDEVVAAREADADEFYTALAPDGTDAERMRDPAPGLRGARLEQADVPVRRAPLARRRPRRAGAAAAPPATAATPAGATSTRSTCSRCPTRGSTRGSRPGIWASTASPGRTSTRRSRSTSCVVLLREWFQHPNGALPAYEWNFDDVNPPVHVLAAMRVFADRRRTRPRVPRADLPEAADQLHVVAQPRGRRRQQHLQRRLPRARQHQPDRPLEPARGHVARAGRRHGVDGLLRPRRCSIIALLLAEEDDVYVDMVVKFARAVRGDRAGARPSGPLRRGGRVLLRPARLPVGRDRAGQGADDLGADPGAPGRRRADAPRAPRARARQALRADARRVSRDGRPELRPRAHTRWRAKRRSSR